jgi:uncharacterized protein YqjF (DUF2071 family)
MMAIDIRERTAAPLAYPSGAWRWSQSWHHVLFLHWPAATEELRERLPAGLEIDTYDGQAWMSFVGFRLENVRLRGFPALPFCSQMLELNFRTYVRYRNEPAIYFLTMHADHRWMVAAARLVTPLPYELAGLDYTTNTTSGEFVCRPWSKEKPLLTAKFRLGDALPSARPDSLDAWLTERYIAYVGTPRGRLLRMQVWHEPWQLREISLLSCQHQIQTARGLQPKCHYSAGVSSLLWPFELM